MNKKRIAFFFAHHGFKHTTLRGHGCRLGGGGVAAHARSPGGGHMGFFFNGESCNAGGYDAEEDYRQRCCYFVVRLHKIVF
jgi:hypothetical protein